MTEPRTRDRDAELTITLGLDETVHLDVRYCDVVVARHANQEPLDIRFRGTRRGDGVPVRLFLPQLEAEAALLRGALIPAPLAIGKVDRTNSQEVTLAQYALRITRRATTRGRSQLEIQPIEQDGRAAERLRAAIETATEEVVPVLTGKGYAVGAGDVIRIAEKLDAMRSPQR